MQYSDDVMVDADGLVTAVAGAPLDPERMYNVGSTPDLARATDGDAIGSFLTESSATAVPDAGVPLRAVLLGYFAHQTWQEIWNAMDENKDGKVQSHTVHLHDPPPPAWLSITLNPEASPPS